MPKAKGNLNLTFLLMRFVHFIFASEQRSNGIENCRGPFDHSWTTNTWVVCVAEAT